MVIPYDSNSSEMCLAGLFYLKNKKQRYKQCIEDHNREELPHMADREGNYGKQIYPNTNKLHIPLLTYIC